MEKRVARISIAGILATFMRVLAVTTTQASPETVQVNAPDEVLAGTTLTSCIEINYGENLDSGQFDLLYSSSVLEVLSER